MRLGRVDGGADEEDRMVKDRSTEDRQVEVRKVEITEGQVVRWLCYVGFFVCAVLAVVNMSTPGGTYLGFLIGTVVFGIPALKMYLAYQDYERQLVEQNRRAAEHGGGAAGRPRFNFGDDQ